MATRKVTIAYVILIIFLVDSTIREISCVQNPASMDAYKNNYKYSVEMLMSLYLSFFL